MKFSPLQIGIYVACVIGIIVAVVIFSGKVPIGTKQDDKVTGSVTMWGTLPSSAMKAMTDAVLVAYPDVQITYTEKNPATFQSDLLNALASGKGPDLITVNPTEIIQNRDRLFTIPFTSLPRQTVTSTFTDQSELFMTPEGVLALPLFVDPMIMYYNRDLLTSSFVVQTPKTWDEVIALNKQVTRKNDGGLITTATVALGTFDNITHAKDLVTMMILQAGGSLVNWDATVQEYKSGFMTSGGPIAAAFRMYTSFSDPANTDGYSWNPTLPNDKSQFIAGKLAIYFGYASEIAGIRARNPNLNFSIDLMPQSARLPTKVTFGRMTGVAITKNSKQASLALMVANQFAKRESIEAFRKVDATYAPVRRDMLIDTTGDDPVQSLVFKSTIIAKSFLDPEIVATNALFKKLIDQVNAKLVTPEAITVSADALFQAILDKFQPEKTGDLAS